MAELQKFRYDGPDAPQVRRRGDRGDSHDLITNERVISTIQIMQKGQANAMHMHRDQDGYWFVLAGRARFHGVGEEILAELNAHDGFYVPHNTRYWFESVDDEPLQILRVSQIVEPD
jgi:mannose-6-phosphate isomerase-like protein (cupin superfamily)